MGDRVTVISGAVTTIPVGGSPTSGSTSSTASSTSSSTRSAASAGSTGSSSGASAGSSSSQGSDQNGHSPPMPMNQSNSANINSSQPDFIKMYPDYVWTNLNSFVKLCRLNMKYANY